MKNKNVVSVALAAVGVALGIRSLAESTYPASNANPTNAMSGYAEALRRAVVSGTEATNLSEVEIDRLMNDSIKTNLAAQLLFRQAMAGRASVWGAKMAQEVRALEALRAGHTEDAIRILENDLDGDIILLSGHLKAGDQTKSFQCTPGPLKALHGARDYRLKFLYRSGNEATDAQVKSGLSYVDEKQGAP